MNKKLMLVLIVLGIFAYFFVLNPQMITYSGPVDLRLTNLNVYVSGYSVISEFDLRNWGANMPTGSWMMEMEVVPKGQSLSIYPGAENMMCDVSHPENVHTLYNLVSGESDHFKMISGRPVGEYDVYLCSISSCYKNAGESTILTPPYYGCTKVATVKVNSPMICVPSWKVGSWGSCYDSGNGFVRIRDVIDENNCGVQNGKPDWMESCSSSTTTVRQGQITTTTVSGGSGGLSQNAILGIAIIAGLGVALFIWKRK